MHREQVEKILTVEVEREVDGRWIGEVRELAGVMVYGVTREDAVAKAKALAFRVLADRLEHGEEIPEIDGLFAVHPTHHDEIAEVNRAPCHAADDGTLIVDSLEEGQT